MEEGILKYFKGYVRIRISGKSAERFLNLCAYHDCRIWNLVSCGQYYEGNISKKDFFRLRPMIRKCHVSVRVMQKHGIPFLLFRYRKRKIFMFSIILAAGYLIWMSGHIWNISLDGNVSYSDEQIFEYLESADVRYGMRKSSLDCKDLSQQIRSQFTSLAWVSVKTEGTSLNIQVKENYEPLDRTDTEELNNGGNGTSLFAVSDGIIDSVFVRNGVSHVSQGDTVEKGMLLVSGVIPVLNDAGERAGAQFVNADADIVVRKNMKYSDTMQSDHEGRYYTGKEKHFYTLKIGTLTLGLPVKWFRIDNRYSVLSEMHQLKLSDNFYLPVFIEKYTAKEYENVKIVYTKEKCEQMLFSDFEYFLKKLEEKGVQIFENDVKIEWNEKSAILSGNITAGITETERRPVADIEEEIQKNEYG